MLIWHQWYIFNINSYIDGITHNAFGRQYYNIVMWKLPRRDHSLTEYNAYKYIVLSYVNTKNTVSAHGFHLPHFQYKMDTFILPFLYLNLLLCFQFYWGRPTTRLNNCTVMARNNLTYTKMGKSGCKYNRICSCICKCLLGISILLESYLLRLILVNFLRYMPTKNIIITIN